MPAVTSAFKRLSPGYKAIVALVAPIGTIIATLLALNVIQPFGEDALAAGVDRTSDAATAAINVQVTSGDLAFDAAGDFDYRSQQGLLRYDFSRTPGAEGLSDVEVVYSRGEAYMKLAQGERPWIHVDLATVKQDLADLGAEAQGVPGLGELDFSDPSQALAQLRRATEVEEIGSKTIYSVPTTGYRGVIEPEERGAERLTATAWIGGDDLIRRLELEGRTLQLTMDFTEFGKPVAVRLPPDRQVQELEDALLQL
jgi:hypothetical protein